MVSEFCATRRLSRMPVPTIFRFVTGGRAAKLAGASAAGCLLVPSDFDNAERRTVIRASHPRSAMARAIRKLHRTLEPPPGVHPSAVIGPGAIIEAGTHIGPLASIGAGVRVGAGSSIGAGSVIGDFVVMGEKMHAASERDTLSRRHAGTRSGAAFRLCDRGRWLRLRAHGRNLREFSANRTRGDRRPRRNRREFLRGSRGAGSYFNRRRNQARQSGACGTQLPDRLSCGGRRTNRGFSGGVVVEDYAVIGGQVGVGDKARIEARAVVGSGSGILTSKIVRAGQPVWGTPARPLKEHLGQLAVLSRLAKRRKTEKAS